MKPQILFLVGPTGSGKSEIAVKLAKELNGEIISCDSMVVYRGMNIGTAKLTLREREGVKHHLIDLKTPRQQFSVNEYRNLALEAIQKIIERKKLPIVVGGSGLYIQALTDGLVPGNDNISKVRKVLEAKIAKLGTKRLHARLEKIDPDRAREILPTDARRITRALEIYEVYGIKPSVWREKRMSLNDLGYDWLMVGLSWDRGVLYNRINLRVEQMMEKGFEKEVKRLQKQGLSRTARQAIGYAEILSYLKGQISLAEAIATTQKRSRHLAKKQLTWWRKENRVSWIPVNEKSSVNLISETAVNLFKINS